MIQNTLYFFKVYDEYTHLILYHSIQYLSNL
jgi:hypothetical protein